MDARGHLTRLGWKGDGHALGQNSNGLKKPLLISFKDNALGVGSKKQKEKQADQWWLRAFDSALKDFGTGKDTTLNQISKLGVASGGLYAWFVKGESLVGTIEEASDSSESSDQEAQTADPVTTATMSVTSAIPEVKKDKKSKPRKSDAVTDATDSPEAASDLKDSKKRKRKDAEVDGKKSESKKVKKSKRSDDTGLDGSPQADKADIVNGTAANIDDPTTEQKVKKRKDKKTVAEDGETTDATPKKSKKSKRKEEAEPNEKASEPATTQPPAAGNSALHLLEEQKQRIQGLEQTARQDPTIDWMTQREISAIRKRVDELEEKLKKTQQTSTQTPAADQTDGNTSGTQSRLITPPASNEDAPADPNVSHAGIHPGRLAMLNDPEPVFDGRQGGGGKGTRGPPGKKFKDMKRGRQYGRGGGAGGKPGRGRPGGRR